MLPASALVSAAVVVLGAATASTARAATVTVLNQDDPGEGLNDAGIVLPVGGNPGTTLGQQRLLALQFAADRWGEQLASPVEILIGARFDALGGDATGAVLGFAGPRSFHADFPGAPLAGVFYPAALANSRAAVDLNPNREDIRATFNSDVDGVTVLGPIDFYYGFDRLAGADVDLVTVALHELAHGLGFLPLFNLTTGAKTACVASTDGCDGAFDRLLEDDNFNPSDLPSMTDAERAGAAIDAPDLLWGGQAVRSTSGGLTAGVRGDGRVEIYAPSPLEPGSSVAHFSTAVSPNELMEPAYTAPNHDLLLTVALFADLGWRIVGSATTSTTSTSLTSTSTTTTTSTTSTLVAPRACGDADGDGKIEATDALIALRTSVGSASCPAQVCDVDSNGSVAASDARRILKAAVGEPIELVCP